MYFNDNINNVVKERITEIRIQNYNRKQLTNKCDEKISRNKWKLGISHYYFEKKNVNVEKCSSDALD